jgi:hypothetical protein
METGKPPTTFNISIFTMLEVMLAELLAEMLARLYDEVSLGSL